jgi:hypothetical protein
MRLALLCPAIVAVLCIAAHANEPQSLSATIDGTRFVGDDDTILLVPLDKGAFSLVAATAGAASYPPPKTPIDRLSIHCDGFAAGATMQLGPKDFASAACNATFSKAATKAGDAADEYSLDKDDPGIAFEITAAHAKVVEGRFALRMKNKAGKVLTIADGRFVAEDRQL